MCCSTANRWIIPATILVCLVIGVTYLSGGGKTTPRTLSVAPAPTMTDDAYVRLLAAIRPSPDEDAFDKIPWQISIHAARTLAAKEGKPVLLWEMDGHPLGCG